MNTINVQIPLGAPLSSRL